jgi:hypothetical protein
VTKSTAERLLEKAAKNGSATAAVELARVEARKAREKRKPNATQVRAELREAKRQATSTSRSTSLVGPDHPQGYTERLLAYLLRPPAEPDVAEEAWLAAAEAEYAAACAAYAWPDDRSPAEVAAQEQMDAEQRGVQAWQKQLFAANGQPPGGSMTQLDPDSGRRRSAAQQEERAARAVWQGRAARAEELQKVHPPEPFPGPPTPIGSPRRSAARQKPTTEPQED